MKKLLVFCLSFAFCILNFAFLYADPGVIIEAKGKVAINQGGKTVPAKTGAQFNDDAIIEVAPNGSAILMFSNGATKKLNSGEKFTAAKSAPGQSSGSPLIKGLAMAYNDVTSKSRGPVVHGMVKAAPGQKIAASSDQKLDPSRAKQMRDDLNQINTLGLDKDGKALMQAQVYYKYGQNQKMIDILLPVYISQNPPADMIKNLLSLGYEKIGKPKESAKYK